MSTKKKTTARTTIPTSKVDTNMSAPRSFAGVGGVIPTVRMNACEIARSGFFMVFASLDLSQIDVVQAATIEEQGVEFFAKTTLIWRRR